MVKNLSKVMGRSSPEVEVTSEHEEIEILSTSRMNFHHSHPQRNE